MNIGVFGGTFDPPHIGHIILAAEAHHQFSLDHLIWVLTPNPPHKPNQPLTPLPIRLEMVLALLKGSPEFQLSRVEIDRPPPHYAVDTVEILRAEHPGAALTYLIGEDSLWDLPRWNRPKLLLDKIEALGVMPRIGTSIGTTKVRLLPKWIKTKLSWFNAPLMEVSSSTIRERVRSGGHFRYFLHPRVFEIIERESLYRDAASPTEEKGSG